MMGMGMGCAGLLLIWGDGAQRDCCKGLGRSKALFFLSLRSSPHYRAFTGAIPCILHTGSHALADERS